MIFRTVFRLLLGLLGALAFDRLLEKRAEAVQRRREERRPSALVGRLLDIVNARIEQSRARGATAPGSE